VPRGDVFGEYESYLEAQKVVDRLAKADFAVTGLAIVGSDLKTVERVTGRLTYGRAALAGAASGSWLGLFFGLLLFLFSPAPEFSFILAAGFIGAGFGMLFGIVSYALNRRRRDFRSTHQVLASNYQIIIDPSQTARARQALVGGAAWPPPAPADLVSVSANPLTEDPPAVPNLTVVDPAAADPTAVDCSVVDSSAADTDPATIDKRNSAAPDSAAPDSAAPDSAAPDSAATVTTPEDSNQR